MAEQQDKNEIAGIRAVYEQLKQIDNKQERGEITEYEATIARSGFKSALSLCKSISRKSIFFLSQIKNKNL